MSRRLEAGAPSAIELKAQILDSNTIEAYVGFARPRAGFKSLNLREVLFLENVFTPLRGRMTGSNSERGEMEGWQGQADEIMDVCWADSGIPGWRSVRRLALVARAFAGRSSADELGAQSVRLFPGLAAEDLHQDLGGQPGDLPDRLPDLLVSPSSPCYNALAGPTRSPSSAAGAAATPRENLRVNRTSHGFLILVGAATAGSLPRRPDSVQAAAGGRWGGCGSRLLALGLGLLVALLVMEGLVRLFFPAARDHALPRELVAVDPYLGWRLEKKVSAGHRAAHIPVTYTTNSLGYRDRPRTLHQDRRLRILVYGDSQVFGWGIPAEQRFSNLAAARMGSVEVWNLAVPGYGLDQQILSYERDGKDFDADAVIFYVSEATLHRMFFDYLFGMYKPMFRVDENSQLRVEVPRQAPGRSILYKMPHWIYLPYFLDRQLGIWDDRLRRSRMEREASEPRHEILEKTFATAYRFARGRRQKMILLTELPAARRPWLRTRCSGLDLSYMELDLPENRDAFILSKEDPHWNAHCHRLIADQLSSPLARLIGAL